MNPNANALEETVRLVRDEQVEVEAKLQAVAQLRRASPTAGSQLDRVIIEENTSMRRGITELAEVNGELRGLVDKLSSPPLRTAVYLGTASLGEGNALLARVAVGGEERLVTLAGDGTPEDLGAGDRVYLTAEGNAILRRAEDEPEPGPVVSFERLAPGARVVVRDRDQELVVRAADGLDLDALAPGDNVRLDPQTLMARERIERGEARRHLASELATDLPVEAFAGYEHIRGPALQRIIYVIAHPEAASAYGLVAGSDRILLAGPPGCGKTTFARTIAAALHRHTGGRCRIVRVNGAELFSPWVGSTEQNIRALFRDLKDGPFEYAVLFIDEADAIARLRGTAGNVHSDRFLNSLLPEIEGFEGQTRLVLIAATNRVDMLDPAFRERFAWEIEIPRPRMDAARAIFAYHLGPAYPYRPNGTSAEATRQALIEGAVAQLYDPNAAGGRVATLRFRDGKVRTVTAPEVVSGRVIEQICRDARERAFQRHVRGDEPGIAQGDMDAAVAVAIERLRGTLTVHNVYSYLTDLPQDVAVVAVEPGQRALSRRRYVTESRA